MLDGNTMGVPRGRYALLISGRRYATRTSEISDKNVGAIVNCSGWDPSMWRMGVEPRPNPDAYGWNNKMGCQPAVIHFPIKGKTWNEAQHLVLGEVRRQWADGRSVLFHCNRGLVRAPMAVARILELVTGEPAADCLRTHIMPAREVHDMFWQFMEHCIYGDGPWCPAAYEEFFCIQRMGGDDCSAEAWLTRFHGAWPGLVGVQDFILLDPFLTKHCQNMYQIDFG